MALKKQNKVSAAFNMSSMTDIIFLLLLFFMIASTLQSPNDLKVNLPQSSSKTATKAHLVKLGINAEGEYSIAENGQKPQPVAFEEIEPYLQATHAADSTTYVALYADQSVPYKDIVQILDIVSRNKLKLVLATKVLDKQH